MLFSQEGVANFINQNFEPVWQTVRPVPVIRIDFGNGTVLTRTLHGNIATYVCAADGQVLDILPGIYTPGTYIQRLNQLRLLANYVAQPGKEKGSARLLQYHQLQGAALKENKKPFPLVRDPSALMKIQPITKMKIERPVESLIQGDPGQLSVTTGNGKSGDEGKDLPKFNNPEELANWKLLAEDTRLNETIRRRQIHEILAAQGSVQPDQVTKRLYKEVLHADIDDPYLGLGSTLFATYPFQDGPTH